MPFPIRKNINNNINDYELDLAVEKLLIDVISAYPEVDVIKDCFDSSSIVLRRTRNLQALNAQSGITCLISFDIGDIDYNVGHNYETINLSLWVSLRRDDMNSRYKTNEILKKIKTYLYNSLIINSALSYEVTILTSKKFKFKIMDNSLIQSTIVDDYINLQTKNSGDLYPTLFFDCEIKVKKG